LRPLPPRSGETPINLRNPPFQPLATENSHAGTGGQAMEICANEYLPATDIKEYSGA